MRSQKGITLIALVITIIVLLILAGVSISMVLGENGVLDKAQNSVSFTKTSSAVEQVTLAWGSCQTDYIAYGSGKLKNTYFTVSKLNENLSEGEVTAVSYGVNANGDSELAYKVGAVYYKMQVSASGVVSVVGEPTSTAPSLAEPMTPSQQTLASQIDEDNYGDYVNYEIDLGISTAENALSDSSVPKTDWRIFYKSGDKVFLIASDYLPVSKFPTGVFGSNDSKYVGKWAVDAENTSRLTTSGTITSNNSFLFTKLSSVTTTYYNYQAVSTLLDTSKWSTFSKTEYVDNVTTSVIGTPTIEMWVASWNEKYDMDTIVFDVNEKGYQVGLSLDSLGDSIANDDMQTKDGYSDTLYYPHANISGTAWNESFGYWLASPSASYTSSIMIVGGSGRISYAGKDTGSVSVRPVVALKTGIIATKDQNEIWQLNSEK